MPVGRALLTARAAAGRASPGPGDATGAGHTAAARGATAADGAASVHEAARTGRTSAAGADGTAAPDGAAGAGRATGPSTQVYAEVRGAAQTGVTRLVGVAGAGFAAGRAAPVRAARFAAVVGTGDEGERHEGAHENCGDRRTHQGRQRRPRVAKGAGTIGSALHEMTSDHEDARRERMSRVVATTRSETTLDGAFAPRKTGTSASGYSSRPWSGRIGIRLAFCL